MNIFDWQARFPWVIKLLVTAGAAAVAFALGPAMRLGRIGPREMVILLLGFVVGILALVPSRRILKLGVIVWILTFGIGFRTMSVTNLLTVHPSEVFAWLLFLGTLMSQILQRRQMSFALPRLILLITLFALLGVITAVNYGTPDFKIIGELQIFLVLFPTYYVVKSVITTKQEWEQAVQWLILVTVYVSTLGLMDFFVPSLSRTLAGNASVDTTSMTVQGIERVGFVFYGSATAGFLIFTFFGVTAHYFLFSLNHPRWKAILYGLAVLVELVAMYLSGFRGLVYAIGVFLLVYAFLHRRALVLLIGGAIALPFLPNEFFLRLFSLVDTRYADSSQVARINRAMYALNQIVQAPLTGHGWGSGGYVHSDLLQIGANLGIPALVVFLLWVFGVMWKLLRIRNQGDWGSGYASALFATFCGLLVIFSGEGLIVWAQFMVPIWFVIGLVDRLAELNPQSPVQAFASE